MKNIKKAILAAFLALILIILLVLGLEAYIERDTKAHIYSEASAIPAAETAIILGASVHSDGKLSPILKDRVDTALQLFKNGKVQNILISGDHREDDYNEVSAMKNYLLERGVPEASIISDHSGIDTYDSMFRADAVFNVDNAIVVTQQFHLPRTIFIARNLDLKYYGLEATSNAYQPDQQILRREKLANVKALWEILIHKKPSSLENNNP